MNRTTFHNIKCNCKLAEFMRASCPLPGTDYRKLIMVEMKPGNSIPAHQHKGHTVLYYPRDSSPLEFHPAAGSIIYLPPGTPHRVQPIDKERVSFAMIIDND